MTEYAQQIRQDDPLERLARVRSHLETPDGKLALDPHLCESDFSYFPTNELASLLLLAAKRSQEDPSCELVINLIVNAHPTIFFALSQYARKDIESFADKESIVSIFNTYLSLENKVYAPQAYSSASRAYASLIADGTTPYSIQDLDEKNRGQIQAHLASIQFISQFKSKAASRQTEYQQNIDYFLQLPAGEGRDIADILCAEDASLTACYQKIQSILISSEESLESKNHAFERLMLLEDAMLASLATIDSGTLLFLLSCPSITNDLSDKIEHSTLFGGHNIAGMIRAGLKDPYFKEQVTAYLVDAALLADETSPFRKHLFSAIFLDEVTLKECLDRAFAQFGQNAAKQLEEDYLTFHGKITQQEPGTLIDMSLGHPGDNRRTLRDGMWVFKPSDAKIFDDAFTEVISLFESSSPQQQHAIDSFIQRAGALESKIRAVISNKDSLEEQLHTWGKGVLGIDTPAQFSLDQLKRSYCIRELILHALPKETFRQRNILEPLSLLIAINSLYTDDITKSCTQSIRRVFQLLQASSAGIPVEPHHVGNLCRALGHKEEKVFIRALPQVLKTLLSTKREDKAFKKYVNGLRVWRERIDDPTLVVIEKYNETVSEAEVKVAPVLKVHFTKDGTPFGRTESGLLNFQTGEFLSLEELPLQVTKIPQTPDRKGYHLRFTALPETGLPADLSFFVWAHEVSEQYSVAIEGRADWEEFRPSEDYLFYSQNKDKPEDDVSRAQRELARVCPVADTSKYGLAGSVWNIKANQDWLAVCVLPQNPTKQYYWYELRQILISRHTGEPIQIDFFGLLDNHKSYGTPTDEISNFKLVSADSQNKWIFAVINSDRVTGSGYFIVNTETKKGYPIEAYLGDKYEAVFSSNAQGDTYCLIKGGYHNKTILYNLSELSKIQSPQELVDLSNDSRSPRIIVGKKIKEQIGIDVSSFDLKDSSTQQFLQTKKTSHTTHCKELKFSPDGRWKFAYLSNKNGMNVLYDLDKQEVYGGGDNGGRVSWDLVFTNEQGRGIVEKCEPDCWSLIDLDSGRTLASISGRKKIYDVDHIEGVLEVTASSDGKWLVVHGRSSTYRGGLLMIRMNSDGTSSLI